VTWNTHLFTLSPSLALSETSTMMLRSTLECYVPFQRCYEGVITPSQRCWKCT